jgi:NAD(P)H-hydrate epimerase
MRLPEWLEPLLDSNEQRALDRWAIEELGVPSLELMERAGTGLAELVADRFPEGRIVVVCGKGNNGGDGLVAARVLRAAGRDVDVATAAPLEELRGDARANLERLAGPPPLPLGPGVLDGAAVIVDAILGTGSSGEPREPAKSAIGKLLGGAPVIACDVPSGVDASTGEVPSTAVHAVATVTFHASKPGLWIQPGKSHAGEIERVEIGIPAGGPVSPQLGLIDEPVLDRVPRRGADSTKFAAGSVLICGGSTGLTGAPCLASESAMRAGAGYVTAAVPSSLNGIFESRLLEVMTLPLPDENGSLVAAGVESVLERLPRVDSLVLGPGLGRAGQTTELARELARRAELPLLLDADGLNAHAEALELLAPRVAPTELGRLLGVPSAAIAQRRLHSVRRAAAAANAIVVLKGDDTLVAEPGGRVAVSRGGSPALATAGTGDVLSGVIGAFLAKRMEPFAAACAGVFVHAVAGQDVGREIGVEGAIAGDVITRLPRARRRDGAGWASDRLG